MDFLNLLDVHSHSINDPVMSEKDKTFEEYIEWMISLHGDGLRMDNSKDIRKLSKLVALFVRT